MNGQVSTIDVSFFFFFFFFFMIFFLFIFAASFQRQTFNRRKEKHIKGIAENRHRYNIIIL